MMRRAIWLLGFTIILAVAAWAQGDVRIQSKDIANPAVQASKQRDAATQAAVNEATAPDRDKEKESRPGEAAGKSDRKVPAGSKRDPFRSVIQSREGSGADCAAGKKCLVASLVVLKGVVKSPEGMLAVVENQHHKSYFLREKDPVFNGQVVRITPDSIVFREKVTDKRGRETMHEVVKHVVAGKPEKTK